MKTRRCSDFSIPVLVSVGVFIATIAGTPLSVAPQEPILLSDPPECPNCEVVQLSPVVSLGDSAREGMLESGTNRVRAAHDRYYLFSPERPYFWVFDSSGQLVRRVGRKGQGPGEFSSVPMLVPAENDLIYVFDSEQPRLSVYGSTRLELIRTESLTFGVNFDAAIVDSGIVVNAGIHTAERIGYPLHLVDILNGNLVRSFGSRDGLYRPDLRDIIDGRAVGRADGDAVWSGWWNQYVLERWSAEGELTRTLRREADWFKPWWKLTDTRKNPPQTVLVDVVQEDDLLWALILLADPEWRSALVQRGRSFRIEDYNRYQDSVVEAIDLNDNAVRASSRFSQRLRGFAGPGLVYGQDIDSAGNITIPVWDLNIVQAGQDPNRKEEP